MSRNGYWTTPKDTLRVFLVFAEPLNDPHYNDNIHPNWQPGQMPSTAANWFDPEFTGEANMQAYNTKYFHQASLGNYIILGDYYPNLVQINYDDLNYYGENEVAEYLDTLPGNDIITANGLSFNNDFDQWTDTGVAGQPRVNVSDGKIDMIMIIWRVNSKWRVGAQSAGSVSPYWNKPIKNKTGFLRSRFIQWAANPSSGFRHEFSHALLGGNNFHQSGAGGGNRKNLKYYP